MYVVLVWYSIRETLCASTYRWIKRKDIWYSIQILSIYIQAHTLCVFCPNDHSLNITCVVCGVCVRMCTAQGIYTPLTFIGQNPIRLFSSSAKASATENVFNFDVSYGSFTPYICIIYLYLVDWWILH